MHIYIPTLGRAHLTTPTVGRIPPSLRPDVSLVVQAHEEEIYTPVAQRYGVSLVVLPESVDRIVATRFFIGHHAIANGHDKIVMIDDDIEFYIRADQESEDDKLWWKLTAPNEDDMEDMFSQIEKDLDEYAHVGISGREGNNRVRESFVTNTRYMRFLAYKTDHYMACEHSRVEVMEDFDIALQLLRSGHPCKVYYEYAQGQAKTQSAGGCSVWRTHDVHNAGAERLAELHPGFVTVRQKQNKTDREGFGTRKEVTVYWKKAFASWQA